MRGAALNSVGFEFETIGYTTDWSASPGPLFTPLAQPVIVRVPPSSGQVWSAPGVNVGASLTGLR